MAYEVVIKSNGRITYIHEYDSASKARAFASRMLNAYDKQGIEATAHIYEN